MISLPLIRHNQPGTCQRSEAVVTGVSKKIQQTVVEKNVDLEKKKKKGTTKLKKWFLKKKHN